MLSGNFHLSTERLNLETDSGQAHGHPHPVLSYQPGESLAVTERLPRNRLEARLLPKYVAPNPAPTMTILLAELDAMERVWRQKHRLLLLHPGAATQI